MKGWDGGEEGRGRSRSAVVLLLSSPSLDFGASLLKFVAAFGRGSTLALLALRFGLVRPTETTRAANLDVDVGCCSKGARPSIKVELVTKGLRREPARAAGYTDPTRQLRMAAATASAPSDGSSVFLTTTMPSTSYLTPATYDDVVSQTLGLASNPSAIMTFESRRSQACGLIAAVGAKVGLPQRTVDTAFVLWHKFTIYHGASSGNAGQHVAQAALFLACKLNDTPKKSRELILASYPLRYPELVRTAAAAAATATSTAGSKGVAPPPQLQNPALANLQESDVDSQLIDSERNKVLHLERAMLDALGYDFKIRQGVESVSRSIVKLGRAWKLSKALIQSAWRIASDM